MNPSQRLAEIQERFANRHCICWECESIRFLLEFCDDKRVIWATTEQEYQEHHAKALEEVALP